MKYDISLAKLVRSMRRRLLLLAGAGAVSVLIVGWLLGLSNWPGWAQFAALTAAAGALAGWTEHWWRQLQGKPITEHLNRRWPALEDSAQLLLDNNLAPDSLSGYQRRRVAQRLSRLSPITLPRGPLRSLAWVLGAFSLLAALPQLMQRLESQADAGPGNLPVKLIDQLLTVQPPSYTALPAGQSQSLSLKVPQFSVIRWQLTFSAQLDQVWLVDDSGNTTYAQEGSPGVYGLEQSLSADQVYQIGWRRGEDSELTTPALISVIRDQAPVLQVLSPEFSPQETANPDADDLNFVLEARDDYGLSDGIILATVAKGDGEGVKFRDVELAFSEALEQPEGRRFSRSWKLQELGLEPGDELYFRALVRDNRQPEPQVSRSPVMLLRWLAPRARKTLALDGIAVDILPEYFRSQRQIIIDTERLLAQRDELSAAQGMAQARRLAQDQKSLRIRYGQYLGEEYESDIGVTAAGGAELDESHQDESFSDHMAHGDQAPEMAEVGHHHDQSSQPGQTTIGGLPAFMADFVHAHDSAEQATLFDSKTRQTLKDALSQMWQSELYLQLTRPATALPYQYQALAYLKQVQQANRIYVRRAGFEPPALDPGKRLSGDTDDSADSRMSWQSADPQSHPQQRLGRLLGDLTLGQPQPQDLAALSELISQPEAAATARLAAAQWQAGNCPECISALQSIVWTELMALPAARLAPANVARASDWGTLSELYLAPLPDLPKGVEFSDEPRP